ncbi:GNAT family N-acetyltransferase [Kitasatospora purpeofusca]|uniref:GNAT family N-acetyltransferase n=1 Tax=Kitasatospora purpeofusca TaxID=67352 RepID=UPI00387093E4
MSEIGLHLSVRSLTDADLPSHGWAGSPKQVGEPVHQIRRAEGGEVAHLAVCTSAGLPVAVCGIDGTVEPSAGTLWQLGGRPALRSCGIGTLLVRSAERRIGIRGLTRTELGVEESNPHARALDERLGRPAFGRELESWDMEAEDSPLRRHETMCTPLRKDLTQHWISPPSSPGRRPTGTASGPAALDGCRSMVLLDPATVRLLHALAGTYF